MSLDIRSVVLDIGNVISPQNEQRLDKVRTLTGLPKEDFDRAYEAYRPIYDLGQIDGPGYWRRVFAHGSTTPDEDLLDELTREDTLSWSDTDHRIIDWITRVREAGIQIAILSNVPWDKVEHLRNHCTWLDRFDFAFLSCELGMIKPNPEIYEHALESMKTPANQILFIDDKPENIEAANLQKINTFLYESFDGLAEFLTQSRCLPPLS